MRDSGALMNKTFNYVYEQIKRQRIRVVFSTNLELPNFLLLYYDFQVKLHISAIQFRKYVSCIKFTFRCYVGQFSPIWLHVKWSQQTRSKLKMSDLWEQLLRQKIQGLAVFWKFQLLRTPRNVLWQCRAFLPLTVSKGFMNRNHPSPSSYTPNKH